MARLHEHQGKRLLREHGVATPHGEVVSSPADARKAAESLGGRTVLKAQAWVTGRKAKGGVVFADSPERAAEATKDLLALRFGNFPVTEVLVEERLDIEDELFVSIAIDDAAQAPVLLLGAGGGTGVEERGTRVERLPVDATHGVEPKAVERVLASHAFDPRKRAALTAAIVRLVAIAKASEARSLEINPLVVTTDGRVIAADCRVTIDDYAVFRHPDLGIEIARELDHPATPLERQAYEIEQSDHRGTFYFAQLPTDGAGPSRGVIGFHGAGGGGSMMSMDAVTNEGFTLANFCDTSGNPSVAKVYRAARIILAQPGNIGYFGSGSGVASQEQYHSAYGLAKAFIEMQLDIPAVIRLGGNSEDRAVEVLEGACRDLGAPVEGYKKDDTPAFCARRFRELVETAGSRAPGSMKRTVPAFVGSAGVASFPIGAAGSGGRVWIDAAHCDAEAARLVVEHSAGIFALDGAGNPRLAVSEAEVADRDSELIACEIECFRALGRHVIFVDLPVPLLDGAEGARGERG